MKRSKQLQVIVDYFNDYSKANFVTSEHNTTFIVLTNALIQAGQYHGYGYKFKDGTLGTSEHCDYIHVY